MLRKKLINVSESECGCLYYNTKSSGLQKTLEINTKYNNLLKTKNTKYQNISKLGEWILHLAWRGWGSHPCPHQLRHWFWYVLLGSQHCINVETKGKSGWSVENNRGSGPGWRLNIFSDPGWGNQDDYPGPGFTNYCFHVKFSTEN